MSTERSRIGKTGTVDLLPGAIGGTVTWDNLGWTPTQVQVQVATPSGGELIRAWVKMGTVSATGFDYSLSGSVPAAGYELHYSAELEG